MPGAWAAPVVKRPALLLPLTALVMGTCTPLAVLTDELPTKADSLSWDSPLAEAEQLAPLATVVVVVAAVVVVVAAVVVVVPPELALRTMNCSIDHQLGAILAVSTTWTYWALWAGKLTISEALVPVQLATVVHEVLLLDSCTLKPLG